MVPRRRWAIARRAAAPLGLALAWLAERPALAAAPADDPVWRVQPAGRLTLDGGFVMAAPAALATGLSTGVGLGATFGRTVAWGLRASWSSATESSLSWSVTQAELRLRATAALQRRAGRGAFALRLGMGPTLVHESRLRNQGARAGLSGNDLASSALTTLPAADLEAVVTVHVAGRWLLNLAGGPSLTVVDGSARGGWTAQIGAGWQR